MLISGGEVTVPKLFVNNSNGRIGLVGYWDDRPAAVDSLPAAFLSNRRKERHFVFLS
jgi:predicted ATP-dependent Lon-type protease